MLNKDSIKKIIETCSFETTYGKSVIFTNGNEWYIETLINNLIVSMSLQEPDFKIIVFCSDNNAYEKCKKLNTIQYFELINIPELKVSTCTTNTSCDTDEYTRLSFIKTFLISYKSGSTIYIKFSFLKIKQSFWKKI